MNHKKNEEIYKVACESIAGGLLTNFKKDEGSQPIYVKSVEGAKFTDYDDNTYYDFGVSFGPAILGHSNERYKEALKAQIDKMYTNEFSMIQIEAAEKIKACIPGLDVLRFGVIGTEADYQAIRVARAYTGKNMYVKFNGQFHGGADYIIGGITDNKKKPVVKHGEREGDFYSMACSTKGRAEHALDDCFMIEFNDLNAMKELFENHGDEIAAVIMEPVAININGCIAEPGYMEGVRELCDKHNVVMIFDEIITGFRIGLGGAAEFYGVKPDLWTFSKALTGGVPGSVYGGKREIMDVVTKTDVLAAGTFNGHPITAAAIVNVIDQLSENDGAIFKKIDKLGNMLKEGLLEKAKKNGVPLIIQGFPGALVPVFTEKEKIINHKDAIENANLMALGMFYMLMKERGIITNIRLCVGAAHTEEDVKHCIEVSDDVFAEMAEIMASMQNIGVQAV